MADESLRRALTGFPAVQEPRDAPRSTQTTIINIRERLRQIEEQINLGLSGGNSATIGGFPDAPADGNIYGRRNRAWTIIKQDGLKFTYAETAPDNNDPGDEWLESDTGTLYTWMDDGSSKQWVECGAGGAPGSVAGAGTQVDIYDTPGTFSWTKVAGALTVTAYVVGSGGGGGSGGADSAGASNRSGGAGGGGGARLAWTGDAASLSGTETVIVGAGGAGAAGVLNGSGSAGSNGAASSFAGFTAYGGGGGEAGGATNSSGGGGGGLGGNGSPGNAGAIGGGTPFVAATPADWLNCAGGAAGGGGPTNNPGGNGGRGIDGAQGGGAGGGAIPTTGYNGGNAYVWGEWATPLTGGAGSFSAPGAGSTAAGTIAPSGRGAGGAGGGGSNGTTAGAGGAGQQPGGGGGGGGAMCEPGGYSSGAGGAGGDGLVIVLTTFTG